MGESRSVNNPKIAIRSIDGANTDLHWHRQELLAWLNNLLQLNLTKVEQCGTGYVLELLYNKSHGSAVPVTYSTVVLGGHEPVIGGVMAN